LCKDGEEKQCKVHHLVLDAFIGPRPSGYQANHKNGDTSNNRLSNLEWVTAKQNVNHAFTILGRKYPNPPHYSGEKHPMHKLTWDKVEQIRKLYSVDGWKIVNLSKYFHVSESTISHIVKGETWNVRA
jgi:hypothetical protein